MAAYNKNRPPARNQHGQWTPQTRSPSLQTHRKNFSFQEMCFLMHHANYCTDFQELEEIFNLQFDTHRLTLSKRHCTSMMTRNSLCYQRPCRTIGNSTPSTPRSQCALSFSLPVESCQSCAGFILHIITTVEWISRTSKESFNIIFPGVSRDPQQIIAQLNLFQNNNQLLTSLSVFSVRYSWHREYRPAAGNLAVRAPLASNAPSAPKVGASVRLDQDEETHDDYSDNEASMARQPVLYM